EGVGVVVAAVKKDAHQRLVVSAVEGSRFTDRGQVDGQRSCHAQRAQLQATLQDQSPCPVRGAHFCTRYSGQIMMRKVMVASMSSFCCCVLAAVMPTAAMTARSRLRVSSDSWLAVRRSSSQPSTASLSCATGSSAE